MKFPIVESPQQKVERLNRKLKELEVIYKKSSPLDKLILQSKMIKIKLEIANTDLRTY